MSYRESALLKLLTSCSSLCLEGWSPLSWSGRTKSRPGRPRSCTVHSARPASPGGWCRPSLQRFGGTRRRPSGVRYLLARYSWIYGWRLDTIAIETSSSHFHRYCTVSMTAKHGLPMTLPRSYSPDAAWFPLPWSCLLPLLPISSVWSQSPVSMSHRYLRHAFPSCRFRASFRRRASVGLYLPQSCPWKARAWPSGSLADISPSSLAVSPSMILSKKHPSWFGLLSPWLTRWTSLIGVDFLLCLRWPDTNVCTVTQLSSCKWKVFSAF